MAMVRFEDVATRVNTREDRFNTALTYYVGGEHIETGELKVSGRGVIKEADLGPMFYFGFKAGDILFVTRNPHLRKCAKVDFPGICSEKTLVIATKDESVLSQKYLAAVMQSDDFWEFMEENKSGSVNYFVNWSTLAEYEFDLPPLDRQRELADLLWAANDLKEAYMKAISATDEMLKAEFREMFVQAIGGELTRETNKTSQNNNWPIVTLESVCRVLTDGTHFPPKFSDSGIPFLFVSNIQNNKLTYETNKYISQQQYEMLIKRTPLEKGDVLLSIVGSYGHPAVVELDKPFCFQRHIAYLKLKNDVINPYYLHALLLSENLQRQIDTVAQGCAQKTVTLTSLRAIKIALPPLALQREFVAIAEAAEKAKAALKRSLADLEQVMKGLING